MNNWGAVKLGLAVATAGTLGVVGSRRPAGFEGPHAAPAIQSLVSGAAGPLGETDRASGGFESLKKAARGGLADYKGAPQAGLKPANAARKIVRSATLSFEVVDQAKARALVHGVVLRHGAEIFSEEGSGGGDNESGLIVIQAPPEQLDAILKDLEPMGRVVARSIS